MSEISIKKYNTLDNTMLLHCGCTYWCEMPKQLPHKNIPALAARWLNEKFCSKCGGKFSTVEVEVAAVDISYLEEGLFGKKTKRERYICLVNQSKPACIPVGSTTSNERNKDFEKKIANEVCNHLSGGVLLE